MQLDLNRLNDATMPAATVPAATVPAATVPAASVTASVTAASVAATMPSTVPSTVPVAAKVTGINLQCTRKPTRRQRLDQIIGRWIYEGPLGSRWGRPVDRPTRRDKPVILPLPAAISIPLHQLHRRRRVVLELQLQLALCLYRARQAKSATQQGKNREQKKTTPPQDG